MNIPPFWTRETYSGVDQKGRSRNFTANGWSFHSLEEARQQAAQRARKIFDLITKGQKPETYEDYLDRPIQEEIIETIHHEKEQVGLITRNRYGALVLNTACVLIVDVDFPQLSPDSLWEGIVWLFVPSKKHRDQTALELQTLNRIEQWATNNPTRHFRLYQTRMGLRIIFTDMLYEPQSEITLMILDQLESDPLYKKLTSKQECFRARLTPKPWRCNCSRPPKRYPWNNEIEEAEYRKWEHKYTQAVSGYKTCEFLNYFGAKTKNEVIQKIVNIHDEWTCNGSSQPLA
jgi:hypothetical protein